jgi:hypothetical protein
MSRASSARRRLLASNAELLEQAAAVLFEISDEDYCRAAEVFGGQRIGGHVRHVVEFYECLFAGLDAGAVDYDARRRDPEVEKDRRTGRARLLALAHRLKNDEGLCHDTMLWIAMEGSPANSGAESLVLSSTGRELEAVRSHTVHHFALISVLLRYYGLRVPSDFGVSQATLLYRAESAAHQAA